MEYTPEVASEIDDAAAHEGYNVIKLVATWIYYYVCRSSTGTDAACDCDVVTEPSPSDSVGTQLTVHENLAIICVVTECNSRFVCSVDKLLELVGSKCRTEGCDRDCNFTPAFVGCCMVVTGLCCAGHAFTWESSHVKLNKPGSRVFTDNLDIASCTKFR